MSGRGIFAGPSKKGPRWSSVAALGADAVMIADADALTPMKELLGDSGASGASSNVLGYQVLTESGIDLGTVVDVVIEVDRPHTRQCHVVGYEIKPSEVLATQRAKRSRVLLPLPEALAVSGEHLMGPAGAEEFVADDLDGFGAAVLAQRSHQKGSS